VSELRDVAVRALSAESHIFYDANIHKQVTVWLFTAYFTSPHSERDVAVELWACYRHLLEGGKVEDLPITLLNRRLAIAMIRKILRGELPQFEDPETNQGAQYDHGEHGEHGPHEEDRAEVEVVHPVHVGRR
jgi:hypothetical protein